MPRTTPEKVRSVIDVNPQVDVTNHIQTANNVTNKVAEQDTAGLLNTDLLTDIETYLAAHFLALKDPQYESKSTGDASGKFQTGQKGQGFLATDWGATAVSLDLTGFLKTISEGVTQVGIAWLGKTCSEQIDWWDR